MCYYRIRNLFVCASLIFLFSACTTNQTEVSSEAPPVIDNTGWDVPPVSDYERMKEEVKKFDDQGKYHISYNIIKTYLKSNFSYRAMYFAIYHVNEHFIQLNKNNKVFEITTFIDPKSRKKAEEQKFQIISKTECKEICDQFDLMKENLKLYQELLKDYPLQGTQKEKEEYLELNRLLDRACQRTMDSYGNFISYHVISPILAEADKQRFIATYWRINDKQKIRDAVVFLARSFHSEWLYAANEDVRIQFCYTIKKIKDVVGEAEWEELATLTTLLDCADNSKQRGSTAWWGK